MTYKYDPAPDVEALIDYMRRHNQDTSDLENILKRIDCKHEHIMSVDLMSSYKIGSLSIPERTQMMICADCGAEVEEE